MASSRIRSICLSVYLVRVVLNDGNSTINSRGDFNQKIEGFAPSFDYSALGELLCSRASRAHSGDFLGIVVNFAKICPRGTLIYTTNKNITCCPFDSVQTSFGAFNTMRL